MIHPLITRWERNWWFLYLATAGVALVLSQSNWAYMPLIVMAGEIVIWFGTLKTATAKRKRKRAKKI